MSTTLTNGYKLPQDGDLGDTWFDDLEFDIDRLNTHAHDGVDSERLASTSMIVATDTVLTASFADQGDGYWRATVTVAASREVDEFVVAFRDPTTKEQMFLKHEKLNATQFYVFINITQDVEVCYTV